MITKKIDVYYYHKITIIRKHNIIPRINKSRYIIVIQNKIDDFIISIQFDYKRNGRFCFFILFLIEDSHM
jgi:hypothetical protein